MGDLVYQGEQRNVGKILPSVFCQLVDHVRPSGLSLLAEPEMLFARNLILEKVFEADICFWQNRGGLREIWISDSRLFD